MRRFARHRHDQLAAKRVRDQRPYSRRAGHRRQRQCVAPFQHDDRGEIIGAIRGWRGDRQAVFVERGEHRLELVRRPVDRRERGAPQFQVAQTGPQPRNAVADLDRADIVADHPVAAVLEVHRHRRLAPARRGDERDRASVDLDRACVKRQDPALLQQRTERRPEQIGADVALARARIGMDDDLAPIPHQQSRGLCDVHPEDRGTGADILDDLGNGFRRATGIAYRDDDIGWQIGSGILAQFRQGQRGLQ